MGSNFSNGEKKLYWRCLKKVDNQPDQKSYVPGFDLIDHFKQLATDKKTGETTDKIPDTKGPGKLDYIITKEELDTACNTLKRGKAPGLDNILNEMLTPFVHKFPETILTLFNSVLKNNKISHDWLVSSITAIHKKDDKSDPNNYRGISVMSNIGKLFLIIMNNRLTKYAVENDLLSPGQLGFVKGNRTSDPHIILHNLIQKYCHKQKKKLFGCFVDFSKAFDSVSRNLLLKKLREKGVDGNFLNIIKTIYTNDESCVKIGNKRSDMFKPNKGVRQGCVLSPLLFNIFLADLEEQLNICGGNPIINREERISCILWADDILILSESEETLQNKLDTLASYCQKNELLVNTNKTQCMVFNRTGRTDKHTFYINGAHH